MRNRKHITTSIIIIIAFIMLSALIWIGKRQTHTVSAPQTTVTYRTTRHATHTPTHSATPKPTRRPLSQAEEAYREVHQLINNAPVKPNRKAAQQAILMLTGISRTLVEDSDATSRGPGYYGMFEGMDSVQWEQYVTACQRGYTFNPRSVQTFQQTRVDDLEGVWVPVMFSMTSVREQHTAWFLAYYSPSFSTLTIHDVRGLLSLTDGDGKQTS